MIVAILAVTYITYFCYLTGRSLFSGSAGSLVHCFTGLAFHGILFTAVSLAIPVGTILAQGIFICVSLGLFFWRQPVLLPTFYRFNSNLLTLCMTAAAVVMLLLHAAPVNHPDTLTYHAQNIRWAAEYRAIPGVVNLQYHFGLQSSMFVVSALFSFHFTGVSNIGFANLAVCTWLVLFIFQKIAGATETGRFKIRHVLPWFLLLGFSFWSFTQVRLSVSSGSIDFIAAVYCWLCFYLVFPSRSTPCVRRIAMITLLACFATSIKFSATPLLLLLLFDMARMPGRHFLKRLLWPVLAVCLLLPILGRNLVASGYPLFPAAIGGIGVNWKADHAILTSQQHYIRAFARTGVEADSSAIEKASHQTISAWLPVWWKRLSPADRALLLGVLLFAPFAIVYNLRNLRKLSSHAVEKQARDRQTGFAGVTFIALTGVVLWFIMAPDPRFGYGFLIPLAASGLMVIFKRNEQRVSSSREQTFFYNLLIVVMLVSFISYGTYRTVHFFSPRQLLTPAGMPASSFHQINCHGIMMYIPDASGFCADAPLPCSRDCGEILPRGNNLTDGFRSR